MLQRAVAGTESAGHITGPTQLQCLRSVPRPGFPIVVAGACTGTETSTLYRRLFHDKNRISD
jgi:hypothetical protein